MNGVGTPERATQNRVNALFRDELVYRYLGDWTDATVLGGLEHQAREAKKDLWNDPTPTPPWEWRHRKR